MCRRLLLGRAHAGAVTACLPEDLCPSKQAHDHRSCVVMHVGMRCLVFFSVIGAAHAGSFPESWGEQPATGTMDYRPLPGGYGHGSSTLANWIRRNMEKDRDAGSVQWPPAWGDPPRRQTRDLRPLPFGCKLSAHRTRDAQPFFFF